MKTILYIIQKEFIQVLRNKLMVRMIVVVPIMQMLVLVFAATFDLKNVNIYLADKDLSAMSRDLAGRFEASPFFSISDASFDEDLAVNSFETNEADFALIIPAGFERSLVRDSEAKVMLLINAVNENKASLIYSYARNIIMNFNNGIISELQGGDGLVASQFIEIAENYWFNPELDYKWYMAPGILAILVTVIGMFLSGMNLVREKEIGTIEQLNVTPVMKYQFIMGKLAPFVIIALFDLAFGLLIARLVFALPVVGSLTLLFAFAALFLTGALGLGLFISTVSNTQQQVMLVTFFFVMVFILMGGIFTPVESMPQWAQWLNRLNPVYYFMRIMRMVVLKGSGFYDLWSEFVSLSLIGVAFLFLAVRRYKKTS